MSTLKRPRNAGFTLLEMTISATLLALLVYAVSSLALAGGQAQEYARRLNRATEISQDLMDNMRLELVSSVRMFGNDTEGAANLAIVNLTGAPAPIASRRLPSVSPLESLRRDTTGNQITGNSMFFTKLAWSDRFMCTSGNDYMVDVYRWVYYYLTPEAGGPQAGSPIGLNIVRVVSEPMADANGIDRITIPADLAQVLLHLNDGTPDAAGVAHPKCDLVWVRGGLPAVVGTIRQIRDGTGTLVTTPEAGRANPWRIERMPGPVTGMLSFRHHSVATNFARSSFGVATYGISSSSNGGFPHGFEVQVVGPSAARQILLHLVVASTHRSGHYAWSNQQVAVSARDL
jgi:type II secretory pathway pseudopilin PulG